MVKKFLFIILIGLFADRVNAQTSFLPVESQLNVIKNNDLTELNCSGPTISVSFKLKHRLVIMPQNNFVSVDNLVIQIIPLQFSGYKKDVNEQNKDDEKLLLETYSNYELNYFKNDLHVELINPGNQWVMIKLKGWFIWYFKVGNIPDEADKKTKIQLFASTIIGNNILTINAPVFSDDDFTRAGLIVNDMMETLTISKK